MDTPERPSKRKRPSAGGYLHSSISTSTPTPISQDTNSNGYSSTTPIAGGVLDSILKGRAVHNETVPLAHVVDPANRPSFGGNVISGTSVCLDVSIAQFLENLKEQVLNVVAATHEHSIVEVEMRLGMIVGPNRVS